jgi:hypothetical protein
MSDSDSDPQLQLAGQGAGSDSDSSDSDVPQQRGGKFNLKKFGNTVLKGAKTAYKVLDKTGLVDAGAKAAEKMIMKQVSKQLGPGAAGLVQQGLKEGAKLAKQELGGKGYHHGGALGLQGGVRGYGMKPYGTREEVIKGLAQRTRGGLYKKDLALGRNGSIVSALKQQQALKRFGAQGANRAARKLYGKRGTAY